MNRLVAILIGALCFIILYLYIDNNLLQAKVERGEDFESLYKASLKEAKIWKDKDGHFRNQSPAVVVNATTLKSDPVVMDLIKQFPSIKKSLRNLEALNQLQAETISNLKGSAKDTNITTIIGKDTFQVKVKKVTAKNEWNDYDITVIGDSADVKRIGREEFDQAVYWERLTKKGNKTIWPFGKKEWSSEIISKNPETKIVKQGSLLVRKKK